MQSCNIIHIRFSFLEIHREVVTKVNCYENKLQRAYKYIFRASFPRSFVYLMDTKNRGRGDRTLKGRKQRKAGKYNPVNVFQIILLNAIFLQHTVLEETYRTYTGYILQYPYCPSHNVLK